MKILLVSPLYYPHVGGVEHVVQCLAQQLSRRGYEVAVLAGEPGSGRTIQDEVNGITVIRWPTWSPGGAYHIPKRINIFIRFIRDIAREYDVVHVHNAHAVIAVLAGLIASRETKTLFTPHYHGGGHTTVRRLLWNTAWRKIVRDLIRKVNLIHVVSPAERELLIKDFPIGVAKMRYVPNGVSEDVANFKWRGEGSDYMIYAGRLECYKGVREAVELADKLGLRIVFLGRGSCEKWLNKATNGQRVEIHDFKPRPQYLATLAEAKYAVNLSRREAFSLFIAEALKMGIPSIVSQHVAKALGARCEDTVEGYCLVKSAPIYTWGELIDKYLELYNEVVSH
ncbi:glycosyltransferase family 4 protein [Pyrobaculum sp.]|uniref:glycosyltransferase family 4 protein n=1 Tax=Pyrobaculum sp. TaxID=2004705 RepID=UPI00317A5401